MNRKSNKSIIIFLITTFSVMLTLLFYEPTGKQQEPNPVLNIGEPATIEIEGVIEISTREELTTEELITSTSETEVVTEVTGITTEKVTTATETIMVATTTEHVITTTEAPVVTTEEIEAIQTTTETETELITEEVTEEVTSSSCYYYLTEDEIYTFAALIYLEAGSTSYQCQCAVASVVINLMVNEGKTLNQCIKTPGRFSVANRVYKTTPSETSLKVAREISTYGPTIPTYVLYFRNNHYFSWATPYMNIDNVYFSY